MSMRKHANEFDSRRENCEDSKSLNSLMLATYATTLTPTVILIEWIISTSLAIGLMSRVIVNGPGDRSLIPDRVIPKTQKMVLDAALFNT